MKNLIFVSLAALLSGSIATASESAMAAESSTSSIMAYSRVSIPTGVFFNGSNFVKVESTWVRIVIGGQMNEYSIRNAEIDPQGNYALVLENGSSITIYSDGRSLYYGGSTYSKR